LRQLRNRQVLHDSILTQNPYNTEVYA
jgi:hypothetical protein